MRRGSLGVLLTFGQAVHDSKRKHRPPPVSFFDNHVDVRKLGEIRPPGGSVLADRSIDFRLGSAPSSACTIGKRTDEHATFSPLLDLWVLRHGLNNG